MICVRRCEVPAGALISRYVGKGHVDAYAVSVRQSIALDTFIAAFFETPIFRLERRILALAGKASSAEQIRDLAEGTGERMAAWRVVDRVEGELLMEVDKTPIRTWLAVDGTTLWFGSTVETDSSGRLPLVMRALMPMHALYSRLLLVSARRRLG